MTAKERKPTIYEALQDKLGREPTNAEIKEEWHRILSEGTAERAVKGTLWFQKRRR
jgi:hypothetical protein